MSGVTAPRRVGRRRVLTSLAAIGVVASLAACGGGVTSSSTKPKKPRQHLASATTPTTRAPISYQVKRGDTLTALSLYFGTPVAVIAQANNLDAQAQLTVGQMLVIPSRPPVQVKISPPDAPAGGPFQLNLTGAQPGESVTFEIDAPGGSKFTGSAHTAAGDGSVAATYQSGTDSPGTYTVVATGNEGTSGRASFRVDPPPSS